MVAAEQSAELLTCVMCNGVDCCPFGGTETVGTTLYEDL